MKTLIIRFSVPVEVEVPDDFPITPLEIELSGEDIANDRRDGRYPWRIVLCTNPSSGITPVGLNSSSDANAHARCRTNCTTASPTDALSDSVGAV